jgi:hypothetical protein
MMMEQTEVTSKEDRLSAMRGIFYIAQGCWLEFQSDSECFRVCSENVHLLYKAGVFSLFLELLNLEIE